MARRGRKTKLSSEMVAKLVSLVAMGNTLRDSAYAAGTSERSLMRWLERGAQASRGMHRRLFEELRQAMGVARTGAVAALRTRINDGDLKAITWYLERSDSATWGERTKVDINLETLEPPSPDPKVVAAKEQRLARARADLGAFADWCLEQKKTGEASAADPVKRGTRMFEDLTDAEMSTLIAELPSEQFVALTKIVRGPPPGQAPYRECPGPGWHLCTLPGHNDPPHWVMGSEPDPPHVIDVQSQSEQEGDEG
jgi:hypothetical protein